jgi:hypothetical protein
MHFHLEKGERIMKLKFLLYIVCFCFFNILFATNVHLHPKANMADQQPDIKELFSSFCQIEIINNSNTELYVYGTFDDHSTLNFTVYRGDGPHYISLFYYFYCHNGMYLDILSHYQLIYSGWIDVARTFWYEPDGTWHITSFPLRGAKAESGAKTIVLTTP